MAYARRWRFCADCRKPMFGRYPPIGDVRCVQCNVDRAECAARQMAAKAGPYYDQWLRNGGQRGRPPTH